MNFRLLFRRKQATIVTCLIRPRSQLNREANDPAQTTTATKPLTAMRMARRSQFRRSILGYSSDTAKMASLYGNRKKEPCNRIKKSEYNQR